MKSQILDYYTFVKHQATVVFLFVLMQLTLEYNNPIHNATFPALTLLKIGEIFTKIIISWLLILLGEYVYRWINKNSKSNKQLQNVESVPKYDEDSKLQKELMITILFYYSLIIFIYLFIDTLNAIQQNYQFIQIGNIQPYLIDFPHIEVALPMILALGFQIFFAKILHETYKWNTFSAFAYVFLVNILSLSITNLFF